MEKIDELCKLMGCNESIVELCEIGDENDCDTYFEALKIYEIGVRTKEESKRKYEKYEFCKDVGCTELDNGKCKNMILCRYTAKEFHRWLSRNGFEIEKKGLKECSV